MSDECLKCGNPGILRVLGRIPAISGEWWPVLVRVPGVEQVEELGFSADCDWVCWVFPGRDDTDPAQADDPITTAQVSTIPGLSDGLGMRLGALLKRDACKMWRATRNNGSEADSSAVRRQVCGC